MRMGEILEMALLASTLFLCLASPGQAAEAAKAVETRKYVVSGIKVYSKANSATEAKELAIGDGERRALKELLAKMAINPDYTKYVNDNALVDMISTIRISEEVMTKDAYSGVLTVIFDREFVKYNLENLGLRANGTASDVFLYIPLFIREGEKEPTLLDTSDAWYRAAYDRFFEGKFEDIFLIDNYSLANSGLLTRKHIENSNYTSFEALLSKYASNVVLIAIAHYSTETDRVNVVLKEITAEGSEEKFLNYVNKSGLSREGLIEYASGQLLESIDRMNRSRKALARGTTSDGGGTGKEQGNYINVLIPIPSLREFVFIRNLLKNFEFVTGVETLEVTTRMVLLRIQFSCYEDELTQFFKEKKLDLYYKNDQYFLRYNPT
ncbi:MAG: hypothetical protein LBU15_02690 [Rickettsiales bacterium]|jgi:hypothetical protein|nr:hypothetical protein [Rickettsiales bacterium]